YMKSKYVAEQLCLKMAEKGLPVVMVNPTGPVGPGDIRPTPTGKSIVDFLNGKLPGYLDGGFNLVDVEDVAKGHILAFHKGRIGERYILGNKNISMKEFFLLLERISKVSAPKVRIPYPLALAAASLLELSSKITRKPPPLTVARVQIISKYIYFDCSKAIRELGLPQTSLELSLEKAVRWFRENGYVHV
ncbi:dihydroflavonol-4-reductase, partial [Candidatus Hakubella thermalkaliphila]